MIIAKLKIVHSIDRRLLVSILAEAGYKVSVEKRDTERYSLSGPDYYVTVEDQSNDKI